MVQYLAKKGENRETNARLDLEKDCDALFQMFNYAPFMIIITSLLGLFAV
jgi:hypothetical protein